MVNSLMWLQMEMVEYFIYGISLDPQNVPIFIFDFFITTLTESINNAVFEAGFEFDGSEVDAKLRTNVAQHKIYKFIKENPNCNQRQIRDQLNLSQGNVSRDLKKLIVKGYVNGDTMSGYRVDRDLDNPDIPDM